jgi:hypothetical protein
MSTTDPKIIEQNFEKAKSDLKVTLDSQINALKEMGIAVNEPSLAYDDAPMAKRTAARGAAEQITASVHWWGVDIVMNEKLTQDIISGVTGTGTIGGLIAAALGAAGVVTGGIATLIGAGIAAVVGIKVAQIKITNNGNGVHWPITWVQWAALLAAVPGGPAAILAAGALFLHPVRN